MNKQEFSYILKNNILSEANTTEMEHLVEEFPFFQSARVLYLKGLKNSESYKYNQQLKTTAAHTTDRSILFDYITSKKFNQNSIAHDVLVLEQKLKELLVVDAQIVNGKIEADFSENQAVLDPNLFKPKKEENPLEIGKPLSFKKEESHSFSEWLKLTSIQPIEREPKDSKISLIDAFIKNKPKITAPPKDKEQKNLADEFSHKPEALMTETLAKVYLEQKKYNKAIQAYKILSLKYPEKSSFFADRIKEIKKLNK